MHIRHKPCPWLTLVPIRRSSIKAFVLPLRRTRLLIRRLIGQYLLDMHAVTRDQLNEALDVQTTLQELGQYRSVGSILHDLGYISRRELDAAIYRRQAELDAPAKQVSGRKETRQE